MCHNSSILLCLFSVLSHITSTQNINVEYLKFCSLFYQNENLKVHFLQSKNVFMSYQRFIVTLFAPIRDFLYIERDGDQYFCDHITFLFGR